MRPIASLRVLIVSLLIGFVAQAGFAQPQGPSSLPPPVRDAQAIAVMQSAIAAMGGAAVAAQVSTAVVQGSFQQSSADGQSTGMFTWTTAGTEFRMQIQAAQGSHTLLSGQGNPVDIEGAATTTLPQSVYRAVLPLHTPALALLAELNNQNYSMTPQASAVINGVPALHVQASDNSDAIGQQVTPQDWYFDPTTYLPVRVEYRFPYGSGSQDWISYSMDFGNYQATNGMLVPYQLVLGSAASSNTATVTSVVLNAPVPSSQFDPSAGSAQ